MERKDTPLRALPTTATAGDHDLVAVDDDSDRPVLTPELARVLYKIVRRLSEAPQEREAA